MAQIPLNQKPYMGQVPLQPMPMPQAAQLPTPQLVPVPQVALGPEPCSVNCPSCGASVITTVVAQPTTKTHLMALLLCCICILCTCIPYCVDSCQNADHLCPNCGAYLGTYKR